MAERSTSTYTPANIDEEVSRHWSPASQAYAPADILQRYLRTGWILENLAAVESFYYAGYRRVDVYYFRLKRGDESVEMPVLMNPVVTRLIEEYKLTVIRINSTQEELD
jgi:hypothetical protein